MIISDEQARLAARCVEPPAASALGAHPEVSPELMSRIILAVEAVPDTRRDRVEEAKERMRVGAPEPQDIAQKMIARAICDALR